MVLACKCKGCGKIHMNQDDDLTIELDFIEERIRFICPGCKTNNEMSLESKKLRNERQPLPTTVIMR